MFDFLAARAERKRILGEADQFSAAHPQMTHSELEELKGMLGKAEQISARIQVEETLENERVGLEEPTRGALHTFDPNGRGRGDEPTLNTGDRVFDRAAMNHPVIRQMVTEEYEDSFVNYVRRGRPLDGVPLVPLDAISNVASTNDNESGGYLLPYSIETEIVRKLTDEGVMRQLATVRRTSSDGEFPVEGSKATASLIGENGTYPVSTITWAKKRFGAHKMGLIVKASDEMLNDSFADIPGEFVRQCVEAIGDLEQEHHITGAGAFGPQGITVGAKASGITTASATAITFAELMQVEHALGRKYRQRAGWLMSDSTKLLLRKLAKTSTYDTTFYWQDNVTAGAPSMLLGYPVYIDDNMPAATAGNKAVLFGDFRYYRILDRVGINTKRLNELYAASGQVGWRTDMRSDGLLSLDEAVVSLLQHA